MRKMFGVICALIACLAVIRGAFGADVRVIDPVTGEIRVKPVNLEEKFTTFVSAEVFDFEDELIQMQIIEYEFTGIVNQLAAKKGEPYITYDVIPYEPDVRPPATSFDSIFNTKGQETHYIVTHEEVKGNSTFWDEFKNFSNSVVDVVAGVAKLIGMVFVTLFKTIAEVAKLFISMFFLP